MIPLAPNIQPTTMPTTALAHTTLIAKVAATFMAGNHAPFIHQA
jgi:hypothetical protein